MAKPRKSSAANRIKRAARGPLRPVMEALASNDKHFDEEFATLELQFVKLHAVMDQLRAEKFQREHQQWVGKYLMTASSSRNTVEYMKVKRIEEQKLICSYVSVIGADEAVKTFQFKDDNAVFSWQIAGAVQITRKDFLDVVARVKNAADALA